MEIQTINSLQRIFNPLKNPINSQIWQFLLHIQSAFVFFLVTKLPSLLPSCDEIITTIIIIKKNQAWNWFLPATSDPRAQECGFLSPLNNNSSSSILLVLQVLHQTCLSSLTYLLLDSKLPMSNCTSPLKASLQNKLSSHACTCRSSYAASIISGGMKTITKSNEQKH